MARSTKRTSIAGISMASSEKADKRLANRRYRRRVRQVLATEPGADLLPERRELSNVWTMAKDGKHWFDPLLYPGVLRK
jgi:hypothetical protein